MIREPAVSGLFYSSDSEELSLIIHKFLNRKPCLGLKDIKAIVVPHAGYVYSGDIAASAYREIEPSIKQYQRIILLGPAHRIGFSGISEAGAEAFSTPLGTLQVDKSALNVLLERSLIQSYPNAHRDEHCLEVHLPFIISLFGADIPIVPLLVGDSSAKNIAEVIETIYTEQDLLIISSDLSHYLPYEKAKKTDIQTNEKICALSESLSGNEACGFQPIQGLNHFAKQRAWRASCIDYRNSGDTAGDKNQVVGYGAFIYQ